MFKDYCTSTEEDGRQISTIEVNKNKQGRTGRGKQNCISIIIWSKLYTKNTYEGVENIQLLNSNEKLNGKYKRR